MSINWRTSGDMSLDDFRSSLPAASQIVKRDEVETVYAAAIPYTRLMRGMLEAESSGATNFKTVPATMNNPLNMRIRGKEPFQSFASITQSIIEWKARLTSDTYAYQDTETVADLVHVYAPSNDNNNEKQYTATVESFINRYPKITTGGVPVDSGNGGNEPVADKLTFGLVPHPAYQNRQIWKSEGAGQNNLGKRSVKGVSYHRILGSLWGTDGYFRGASVNALTDYGVGTSAQDGTSHDGEILRWNDPLGFQSGWASGSYSSYAYGDGLKFVQKYGINAINRDRASIEISGFQDTALSAAAEDSIAEISAYWADQYGIPWNVYPIAPQDGFSFVVWHEEFGPDNGVKKCPFDVVKARTEAIIEKTRAILKQYQTQTVEQPTTPDGETYAHPITYTWLAPEEAVKGLDRKIGKTTVYHLPQTYTAIRETPRKQATGNNKRLIGPPIAKGLTFKADYVYRSGNATYVLTPFGTRVKAADLLPKVQVAQSGNISVRKTADATPEVIKP